MGCGGGGERVGGWTKTRGVSPPPPNRHYQRCRCGRSLLERLRDGLGGVVCDVWAVVLVQVGVVRAAAVPGLQADRGAPPQGVELLLLAEERLS